MAAEGFRTSSEIYALPYTCPKFPRSVEILACPSVFYGSLVLTLLHPISVHLDPGVLHHI